MIRHVACFKWKTDFPEAERAEWARMLRALPNQIDFVHSLSVGDDLLRGAKSWDAAVVAELESIDQVMDYINHPLHQAAGTLSAPYIESLVLVDFEV